MSDSQIHLINAETKHLFPAAPKGTVLGSSVNLGWQGITVELHSLPKSEYPEHYIQGHRLAIARRRKPITYEWQDGTTWHSRQTHRGAFFLQSHGDLNTPRWFEPFEIIAISLEPTFIAQCFQDNINCDLLRFQECRAEYDYHIAHFAAHFETELLNSNYGGALYGESMALAFSLYLLEKYSDRYQPLPRPKGQLSSLQLTAVIEYIHAHLESELSLTELATQLNLSSFHFARLFKKSLGLSPHKYVLQNRIERAKKLIVAASHIPLSDVALQVGFYDQTHFSKAFKKYLGVSPKAFSKLAS
ncbi:MAG: AraC family transcriptional regulator [Cyanobacteria bacterium P01_E01_bin.35]